MPVPGVGILVSPVRRKNSLPPPSAVSIRVLQGKRIQQCNVASAFLQILSELYTDILDVQSESAGILTPDFRNVDQQRIVCPTRSPSRKWMQDCPLTLNRVPGVNAWEAEQDDFRFLPPSTNSGTIQGVKGPIPQEVADEGKRYFPILVEKG
jgi:hypothetical protein